MNRPFAESAWSEISSRPRYFWVAAGFLGAASVMALRRYWDQKNSASPSRDDTSRPSQTNESDAPSQSTADAGAATPTAAAQATVAVAPETPDATNAPHTAEGGAKELSDFLAGESWFDESGWSGIWEREGIDDATSWLRTRGIEVLRSEREKLTEHPALLAGCRRRWIVVCRYAGIDVGEAAASWNDTQ